MSTEPDTIPIGSQGRSASRSVQKTFIICLATLIATAVCHGEEFWVSPEGKDTHPGTKERPFATLGKSRQMASVVSKLGRPVTVYLREGTHYLTEPLVFTSDDSGSKNAPVTFQACENEKPVISGGLRLNLDWKPYKNGISQAQLPPGLASDQLFVNNERQILARYPDFDAKERIYNLSLIHI